MELKWYEHLQFSEIMDPHPCEFLVAIITKHHKLCCLKQQKWSGCGGAHLSSYLGDGGRSNNEIHGHPWLHGEFEASLGYTNPCFKKLKRNSVFFYSSAGQTSAPVSLGQTGVSRIPPESLVSLGFSSFCWQRHSWT